MTTSNPDSHRRTYLRRWRDLLALALICAPQQPAVAQPAEDPVLARRPFLGVRMTPAEGGVLVQTVFPQSSASAARLETGDVLESLGGTTLTSPADVLAQIPGLRVGDSVELRVRRSGQVHGVTLELTPFPPERHVGAQVVYGAVAEGGRLLRSLLTVPENAASRPPVVYLLQGIDCSSVEQTFSLGSAWSRLIEQLTASGFATYRVEKAGVGDSTGGPCRDNDFHSETAGFAAGLTSLRQEVRVDAERIYLLGFSMGGVWAPLLAAESPVRGVAAFGTIARPFQEYLLENRRRQDLLGGESPGQIETATELDARLFHLLFAEARSPQEILDSHPDLAQAVRQKMSRDESPVRHLYADRTAAFLRQIHEVNIAAAWEKVQVPVLALWGEGDYVSARADHELIARIVNRDGGALARFETAPSDHWLGHAESEESAYRARREGTPPPLSEETLRQLSGWLVETDARSAGA